MLLLELRGATRAMNASHVGPLRSNSSRSAHTGANILEGISTATHLEEGGFVVDVRAAGSPLSQRCNRRATRRCWRWRHRGHRPVYNFCDIR